MIAHRQFLYVRADVTASEYTDALNVAYLHDLAVVCNPPRRYSNGCNNQVIS